MKKIIIIAVPILFLAISVFIMNFGSMFKSPIRGYDVPDKIAFIQKNIMDDNWVEAKLETEKLEFMLKNKIYPIIQYSEERDEMNHVITSINRMKGFFEVKEKGLAMGEVYELRNHWENLGR